LLSRTVAVLAIIAFAVFCARPVSSQDVNPAINPFAKTDWNAVLRHDPKLSVNQQASTQMHALFVNAADGSGSGAFDDSRFVVAGRVGGKSDWMAAVPLESGGTAGVMTWLIYSASNPTSYVLSLSKSEKEAVKFLRGSLLLRYPDYQQGDANCCASKMIVESYRYVNSQFARYSTKVFPSVPNEPLYRIGSILSGTHAERAVAGIRNIVFDDFLGYYILTLDVPCALFTALPEGGPKTPASHIANIALDMANLHQGLAKGSAVVLSWDLVGNPSEPNSPGKIRRLTVGNDEAQRFYRHPVCD
jgi:hypothetical protein